MKVISKSEVDRLRGDVADAKQRLELAQEEYDNATAALAAAACPWVIGEEVMVVRYRARTRHKAIITIIRLPTYITEAKDYEVGVRLYKADNKLSKMIEYISPEDIHKID